MKNKDTRVIIIRSVVGAFLAVITAFVPKLLSPMWISQAYKPFSRAVGGGISRLTGLVPFSLAEILVYLSVVTFIALIVLNIVRAAQKKSALNLLKMLSHLLLAGGAMFAIFQVTWGLNYHSNPLAEELDLNVDRYSTQILYSTTKDFVEELNVLAPKVQRNADGVYIIENFNAAARGAASAWEKLIEITPLFKGAKFSRPKYVIASKAMSYTGITGIFVPYTFESNINADAPDSGLPFTMCHELAHAAGIAPEKEANFAAFLACRESEDPQIRYSGYLSAFIYAYNALAKDDETAAADLWYMLDDGVVADLRARSEYWQRYEGKIQTVSNKINNTYLMAMSQTDGVKSYGMVVDLLIADYVKRTGDTDFQLVNE